jgi:hypothetical protein
LSSSDKFNLTFSGEIRSGLNVTKVKVAFAQALTIEDAKRVDAFFSGELIILRRNIDKETAEAFYTKMYRAGAILRLVPADLEDAKNAKNPGMNFQLHTQSPGQVDQSWPIPSKQESVRPQSIAEKTPPPTPKLEKKLADQSIPKKGNRGDSKAALTKVAKAAEGAEEAAIAIAQAEAAKKKAFEAAAKLKAEKEAADKKAAREAALIQSIAAAEREAARREAANKKAIEDAAIAKAAEQAALEKTRKEQAKKRAAEEEAARIREEYAENKRIAAAKAAKAAKERAEENRRRAEKKVKLAEQKLKDAIASVALLKEETEKAKADLKKLWVTESAASQSLADRPEVGNRRSSGGERNTIAPNPHPVSRQKHQPGEPNFFSLRPFRATTMLTQRAEKSGQLSKILYLVSVAAMVAFALLLLRTALQAEVSGASKMSKSIIVDENSQLTIAAASHLFVLDRAGVATQRYALTDFGLPADIQLLSGDGNSRFIVQVLNQENDMVAAKWGTLDCDALTSQCVPYSGELGEGHISSWTVNNRTKHSFIAIPSAETLLKFSYDGALIARASVKMPDHTKLQLSNGLLYINSAEGPAISILRPDNAGFGEQLDEIILQPPGAFEAGQKELTEFVWGGNAWWVLLRNPETDQTGLYRFDEQWNFLSQVQLAVPNAPLRIIAWAGKILLLYSQDLPLTRFNARGEVQTPVTLEALQTAVDKLQSAAQWMDKLWWALMAFLAIAATFSFVLAQLYRIKRLIDKTSKLLDAQRIENLDDAISWISPAANRDRSLQVLSLLYAVSSGLILAAIFAFQLPTVIMLSAGIALTGPALFIGFLWRSPTGHIGLAADGLVLVDHGDTYHIGAGSKIHSRNRFLLVDDVVVFTGSSILPVFDNDQLQQHVLPKAIAGVRVDRKTLWIKVIQSRHPIAKGLVACFGSFTLAILCIILL